MSDKETEIRGELETVQSEIDKLEPNLRTLYNEKTRLLSDLHQLLHNIRVGEELLITPAVYHELAVRRHWGKDSAWPVGSCAVVFSVSEDACGVTYRPDCDFTGSLTGSTTSMQIEFVHEMRTAYLEKQTE